MLSFMVTYVFLTAAANLLRLLCYGRVDVHAIHKVRYPAFTKMRDGEGHLHDST